jgi:hypothetical protein
MQGEALASLYFAEVAFIAYWHIWKIRNDKIFRGERPFAAWRSKFMHDMLLHVHRFSGKHSDSVKAWVDSLPYRSPILRL